MLWAHSPVFFLCNFPENTAPPLDISSALCYRAHVQDDLDRFAVLSKKFFVALHRSIAYTVSSGFWDSPRPGHPGGANYRAAHAGGEWGYHGGDYRNSQH